MKLSQFKFKLPEKKIAQYPSYYRDECKLMVVHRKTGEIEHKIFKDLLEYFDERDLFVFNDTKVFPARLYGNKEKTGARIEVFLLRELNEEMRLWDVLVDPARKIRIGNKLYFGEDNSMVAEGEIIVHKMFETLNADPSSESILSYPKMVLDYPVASTLFVQLDGISFLCCVATRFLLHS